MSRLTTQRRNGLPGKDFAGPDRSYPIEDENHARNALARVSNKGKALQASVRRKVHAKFPKIGLTKSLKEQGRATVTGAIVCAIIAILAAVSLIVLGCGPVATNPDAGTPTMQWQQSGPDHPGSGWGGASESDITDNVPADVDPECVTATCQDGTTHQDPEWQLDPEAAREHEIMQEKLAPLELHEETISRVR